MKISDYKLRKFDKRTTLEIGISVTKEFKLRLWVAKKFLKLAAYILNCDLVINTNVEKRPNSYSNTL